PHQEAPGGPATRRERTNPMSLTYATTYHRDGTVTVWDVYAQQWTRCRARRLYDDDAIMATLTREDRARIEARAYGRTLTEARQIARRIRRLADAGGTLQAEDMLRVTSRPELHTAM